MESMNQTVNSTTSIKCGQCKKGVKDDNCSAIGCKLSTWFNGNSANLSEGEVKSRGTKPNSVWLSESRVEPKDICTSKIGAKLNGLFGFLSNKLTSCIAELFPKRC